MGTIQIDGSTPKLTIGNATAEDALILFDGNAQDFHIGLDDTADDLVIGVGSALGTTTALAIDENAGSTFSGTVTVGVDDAGHDVKFFGDTASAYMLWDTSADDLVLAGAAGIDLAGDIDVDGTANLDVVDIDGAVDMASTLQVDGVITTSDGMIITTADNTDTLSLISTDADANVGPNVKLYRNSSSPAADDLLGAISFAGEDDGGNDTEYALIDTVIGATTGGSENGRIRMKIQKGGTLSSGLDINADVIIINDDSKDIDFRVESDGNANMLTVNAGSNIVGIGADPDLGVGLHIKTADSGASVNGEADELVIEGSGYSGITILSGASQGGAVMFGDSGDNGIGRLYYDHSSNTMQLVAGANKVMDLTSGSIVINEDSDDVDFRVESDSSATMFNLQGANSNNSAGSIGLNSSNSDGNFFEAINPQSGVYTALFNSSASSGAVHGISLYNSQQNPDDNTSQFLVASDGSAVRMRIYSDGDLQNHDNSYGSTSDERIKQQIADSTSQWDDLKAVKVRKFKFNSDVADKGDSDALWRLGVIAQELEASSMNGLVKPEVKYKEGDQETRDYLYTEKDKDTGEIPEGKDVGDVKKAKTADVGDIRDYKSVKYSILYMKAIKALQEAQTRIETLETKVTALEG